MPEKLAYPIAEAADCIGVGRSTIYSEIAAGRLASFTIGRRRLIAADALAAYIADRSSDAAA